MLSAVTPLFTHESASKIPQPERARARGRAGAAHLRTTRTKATFSARKSGDPPLSLPSSGSDLPGGGGDGGGGGGEGLITHAARARLSIVKWHISLPL